MTRKHHVVGLTVLLGALTTSAAYSAGWTVVKTWNGSGIKETESFDVQSREWRITWETRNEALKGAGIFQIYVHNDKDELVSLAANKQGVGRDTSYVRGTGTFYLKINSANVDWSVTVEDQR